MGGSFYFPGYQADHGELVKDNPESNNGFNITLFTPPPNHCNSTLRGPTQTSTEKKIRDRFEHVNFSTNE